MTSIRFSFCGGESVMPHYIWQSNLLLIISAEKAGERKCRLTFITAVPKTSFFLSPFFLCVQSLFYSFFLLDLLKLNLICSSAGFDTGAAFWRSKVIQSFLQFEQLWNGFWSIVRHLSFATEKLPTENEILQGRMSLLFCTIWNCRFGLFLGRPDKCCLRVIIATDQSTIR